MLYFKDDILLYVLYTDGKLITCRSQKVKHDFTPMSGWDVKVKNISNFRVERVVDFTPDKNTQWH